MPGKELLKEKDKRFRLLFEEHPQPMWIFDAGDLRILEANAAAVQLYGYSEAEFGGMNILDVAQPEEAASLKAEIESAARPASGPWRHRTKNGAVVDVEMAIHDIRYGNRPAFLAVLMDITGRRQLEAQLRQSQKMEAVGMLAGGVAHDFNNLLTIITGYSQLILNNLAPDDRNRHSAEQIMKAGERAAALTKQLLAFSRRQVLQPKVLELNKLVGGLSGMLQRLIGEDVDLRLVLRPDLGRVSADPGQLEQVVMNLVVNARDAMPGGGTMTLETANRELDENYAGKHVGVKPGAYVMLAVSDTGHGMDESTRQRLFEPFFTTKGSGKGTGLGLSTVFGIVKQSGGSVEVYSEQKRGTSVKVYLPRIDQPVALESETRRRAVALGSETVLLVEDDDMVRNLVRETLEHQGYRIIDSSSPVEARKIADQFKGPIQLLITDVVMPKINGRELALELARRRPNIKVLYMSGYTDSAVLNSGILQGEVAFLQKPFTPAGLTEKVREVLEGDSRSRHAGE
jgi:PAS domain S-box-containing protein